MDRLEQPRCGWHAQDTGELWGGAQAECLGHVARVGIGAAFKLAYASGVPPPLVAVNLNTGTSEARGQVVQWDLLHGRPNGA